ncbi:hypothetical protein ISS37_05230 [candidate division KSB1 bacterium]|nr:hypothetical protein [candidate division KSB1 bacterium]
MKLPKRENAYVPPGKLARYLLSEMHPVGKSKAKFFQSVGFYGSNVDILERSLVMIAHSNEVSETKKTSHGTKYLVDGEIQTPDGMLVQLRTVWIIDAGKDTPRFVTAYPA